MSKDLQEVDWLGLTQAIQVKSHDSFCEEQEDPKPDEPVNTSIKNTSIKSRVSLIMREHCGVSRRHLLATETDFLPEIIEKINVAPKDSGFFITGTRGTGKTHLAVALIRKEVERLCRESKNNGSQVSIRNFPLFVFVPELAQELADSRMPFAARYVDYDSPLSSTRTLIDRYSNINLFVLDDLAAEHHKGWEDDLFVLLDKRYREMKRTIITSNLSLEEISKKLNDRIASRIAGLCKCIALSGKDVRVADQKLNEPGTTKRLKLSQRSPNYPKAFL